MKKGNKKKLNDKQKLFVDWYIKLGYNGTQAAIKVGYSPKSARVKASKLLTKANILAYKEKRIKEIEDLLKINKVTMVQDLLSIRDKCMTAIPVMEWDYSEKRLVQETAMVQDKEGKLKEVGVYEFDSKGANKAVEIINKMLGYNDPEKTEDVTPLDRKPAAVIIQKTYDSKPDQPTE